MVFTILPTLHIRHTKRFTEIAIEPYIVIEAPIALSASEDRAWQKISEKES
jgi:hypothetical protein